jgi:hypothetical protein
VDAWPYFPGLKVGQTLISLLPLRLFDGVDCQSLHFHSAAVDWLNCFLLPFLLTPLGLILKYPIGRTTADHARFCRSQLTDSNY